MSALLICRQKLLTVLDALLDSVRAGSATQPLLLPNLQVLDINLDLPGTWHLDEKGSTGNVPAMTKLRQLTVARNAAGIPLRIIRIIPASLNSVAFGVPPVTIPDDLQPLMWRPEVSYNTEHA